MSTACKGSHTKDGRESTLQRTSMSSIKLMEEIQRRKKSEAGAGGSHL
jgi:hypothetical protein